MCNADPRSRRATGRFALAAPLLLSAVPAAAAPRLMVQAGPQTFVGARLALSPDKRLLATAGQQGGAVYLWELAGGRLLCTLPAGLRGGNVLAAMGTPAVAFSRDGESLVSAADGGRLALWDLRACSARGSVAAPGGTSRPVQQILPLPDGRQLLLGGDGRLHVGDAFTAVPAFAAVARSLQSIVGLLGASGDSRHALVTATAPRSAAAPFPRSALLRVDLAGGAVDELSAYANYDAGGSAIGQLLPPSASISPTGRWVLALAGSQLNLLDTTRRAVAGAAALSAPPSARAAPTPPTAAPMPSVQMPDLKAKMAEMLERLPPQARAKAEAQLNAKLGPQLGAVMGSVRPLEQEAQQMAAQGTMPQLPTWVGFSPREDQVLVWRSIPGVDGQGPAGSRGRGRTVLEVRAVPGLALQREVVLEETGSAGSAPQPLATAFALSADRRLLAVQLPSGDLGSVKLGVVDLDAAAPAIRSWRPGAAQARSLAWRADGRLIVVQSGQASGTQAALEQRSAGAPVQPAALRAGGLSWGLAEGDVVYRQLPTASPGDEVAIAPGGAFVAIMRQEVRLTPPVSSRVDIDVLDAATLETLRSIQLTDAGGRPMPESPEALALSADARLIAALRRGSSPQEMRLTVHDGVGGRALGEVAVPFSRRGGFGDPPLRFTRDGRTLVLLGADRQALIVRSEDPRQPSVTAVRLDGELHDVIGEERLRLVAGERRERDAPTTGGLEVLRLPGRERLSVATDDAGRWLVAGGREGALQLYPLGAGGAPGAPVELQGHAGTLRSFSFSPDGRRLASSADDGSTIVWDLERARWLLKLFSFPDGSWAVVDPSGRFDTNRVEDLEALHWVVPDDPLRALPLEIFMQVYYEPRLLARVLAGERLPPVPDLADLNRAQPQLRIVGVAPSAGDAGRVDVTVEAEGRSDAKGRPGGVYDMRLFRDGKLVGYPQRPGEALALDPSTQRARLVFRGIRLPSNAERVEFSAYAFNRDRVKGPTIHAEHRIAARVARPAKGRAYVVAIGVNRYDDPALNLAFAGNDARSTLAALTRRLESRGDFREVIGVPLVSDGVQASDATKARIRAVLAQLAGQTADPRELAAVPNAARLASANPEDLVLLFFAGHGRNEAGGHFYLLPQDVGTGATKADPAELLRRSIGTEELSAWLRDIDAGEMALVIDACHSAASVEGEGFKPGPMGSRGLGQLAYDKGIRVLAASQANDVAMEIESLRHGLLTYALLKDGLDAARADFRPADRRIELGEWLAYGVVGVPKVQAQLAGGQRGVMLVPAPGAGPAARPGRVQQPRLFDFARQQDGPLLEALR